MFNDAFLALCEYKIETRSIPTLRKKLQEAAAHVEAHWPVCMHTIIFHTIAEDMARIVQKLGPAPNFWGFFWEGEHAHTHETHACTYIHMHAHEHAHTRDQAH